MYNYKYVEQCEVSIQQQEVTTIKERLLPYTPKLSVVIPVLNTGTRIT